MFGKEMKYIVLCISIVMILGTGVSAAQEAKNAGVYTNENEISLYVKGLGDNINAVSCQIGKRDGQQISFEMVEDMETPAKTLIMIDNSLSITKENREKTDKFLKEYIYEKDKEELVAIATFSEEIDSLTEYIADRRQLEDIIDAVEYKDQETYLTDALYDVIQSECLGTEDCYKKIIIISDGVDNKSIGYTKEELYSLIQAKHYPIYTLGCVFKSNNEQLENMFALSRFTGGLSWILDESDDIGKLADDIVNDNDAVHFKITPDEVLMDGSIGNILLTIGSGQETITFLADVRMPFRAERTELVETQSDEPAQESEPLSTEGQEQMEDINTNSGMLLIIAVGGGIVVVLIAAIVIVVLIKRKNSNDFETLQESVDNSYEPVEDDKTLLVRNSDWNPDDQSTQMIWNGCQRQHNLILTDLNNTGKTFQMPITGDIIIGRKSAEANLIIDYDKSVSGKHCVICEKQGKFYVRDLQSSNGTKVNDAFVLSEVEIYSGCILTIGRLAMKVEIR